MANRQSGSDPRFLRRHYPHQVQGVRSTFRADHLSQAAPPHSIVTQNTTHPGEVNKLNICGVAVSQNGAAGKASDIDGQPVRARERERMSQTPCNFAITSKSANKTMSILRPQGTMTADSSDVG